MKETLLEELKTLLNEDSIRYNEPMSKHTTFRIGGNAAVMVFPKTVEEISALLKWKEENQVPFVTVGNGSNLLVSDKGFDGVVMKLQSNFNEIKMEPDGKITAQAGCSLYKLALFARQHGLSGLEFAGGIPGTVGGAVRMNAGAYDGEMSQVIEQVVALDGNGNRKVFSKEECRFGYRRSIIKEEEYYVVEAVFQLAKGEHDAIKEKQEGFDRLRRQKQPLEFPSAGSTFKRPQGYFAGKLIQDAGLRGYQVGGAAVSEKHCGFVINKEKATAKEVMQVIQDVQSEVQKQFGVTLEMEVEKIGDFT
ncbi:MAG: UDP-N-acetylmuramate dehydrogenase [Lachnospiraceae bacterium]|nr:UDP-N-acetylmuramate dehydrogenase [Lachnospiraceae bacterium]